MIVSARIDEKVAKRAMLSHPFYQAWTEGRLPLDTLRAYARQYFHHVEAFPRAVSAVHSACPERNVCSPRVFLDCWTRLKRILVFRCWLWTRRIAFHNGVMISGRLI